jgi:uncharacterized LabA/DUF88 family protein
MPALRSLVLRLETLVITEHTHSENNDWQEPGGEQLSVSETPTQQSAMDAPTHEEGQTTEVGTQPAELSAKAEEEGAVPAADDAEKAERVEEPMSEPAAAEMETQAESPAEENASGTVAEEVVATSVASEQPNLPEGDAPELFPLNAEEQQSLEEAVRPFTDFIEEFRQTEAQFGSLLSEPESSFTAFVAGSESIHEPVVFLETAPEDLVQVLDSVSLHLDAPAEQTTTGDEASSASFNQSEETPSGLTQPRLSPERPVSPLLRPATRPRVPRHGRHRIDELIHPAELRGDVLKAPVPTPEPVEEPASASEAPAPVEQTKPEEQPARPARRYRFDRPAATASATPAAATRPSAPARATESKEKRTFAIPTPAEPVANAEPTPTRAETSSSAVAETPVAKVSTQEPAVANPETPAPVVPVAPTTERRRRGNHERTREKEQAVAAPVVAPVPEPVAPVVEPAPAVAQDVPLEDLPPLEYSELQAANSRRRRRRRPGTASTVAAVPPTNGTLAPKTNLSDLAAPPAPSLSLSAPESAPLPTPVAPRNVPQLPPASYNIVSGYTVSQMNQGNDMSGPFMGPEPSPARGSTFSSTPVRHVRNEPLRNTPAAHPVKHSEAPAMSNAAVNHMANVVSQAIQTQTDRMVAELRRANQVPTSVSVSLPPFPSTERVGVFVDVANLLYSARTLRMTVDFGKLLDFLRGNRRLVRAQAYCPTSPQPGDDQMFLQAVKGLGYRITTKNYKTFSSGAKKADLDLDLCMDVVRLVDGGAVDCVVLVSGDSDFMPMLDYCSDHGVRVEVAAFDESMSATLRQACDLFVNLSMLEEIRA